MAGRQPSPPDLLPRPGDRAGAASWLLAGAGAIVLALSPSTAFTVLALLFLTAGFSVRPALSLPLLGLVLPFYLAAKPLGSLAFSMPELVLLSGLAALAVRAVLAWRRGERPRLSSLPTPLDGPIALFLFAALLSLLASEVPRVSLRDLRTLVLEPVAAYYLAVWLLRNRTGLGLILGALIAGGTAAAALGLYQYLFTEHVVAVEGSRRILGPYLSPNHMGLFLGRILPLALALALFGTRRESVGYGSAAALLGIAIALTFSVGAWLASLLAVSVVLLAWSRRALVVAWAAGAALLVASLPFLNAERVTSHLSPARGTSFIRLQLWESSLRMVADHPVLGVGMDNFLYQYRSSYIRPGATGDPNLSHPHNLVLNFWLQIGFLGVAFLVWLGLTLTRLWFRTWRASTGRFDRAALAGLAGMAADFVSHGMVDNSYFLVDSAFSFWILAGVLVVLARLAATRAFAFPAQSDMG